jgi:hypothetical protein
VKHTIERELDSGEHELVAMGRAIRSGLGRFVLGGISTFVLHRSTVPTLVAHGPTIDGRESVRVVVETDGPSRRETRLQRVYRNCPTRPVRLLRPSVVELELTPPTGPEC